MLIDCIDFQGCHNRKGYGMVKIGGRKGKIWLAHRWAWAQIHSDPGDLCVLHRCDNPACINVEHLFLGTKADNNHDMVIKGRYVKAGLLKTHCLRGHEYNAANTYINPRGARCCRVCRRKGVRSFSS